MVCFHLVIGIAYIAWWEGLMRRNGNKCSTFLHFTHWIPKSLYCIRCMMVCKICFTNWNAKIAFLRTSMVVTYYIKLFRTGPTDNGILNVSTPSSRRDNYRIMTWEKKVRGRFYFYPGILMIKNLFLYRWFF